MTTFTTEQKTSILNVLNNIKRCVDNNTDYLADNHFNLNNRSGLCWHVFAYTTDHDINICALVHYIKQLGYDIIHPIESQITDVPAEQLDMSLYTEKYDTNTKQGKLRIKLLNELINVISKDI